MQKYDSTGECLQRTDKRINKEIYTEDERGANIYSYHSAKTDEIFRALDATGMAEEGKRRKQKSKYTDRLRDGLENRDIELLRPEIGKSESGRRSEFKITQEFRQSLRIYKAKQNLCNQS